MAISFFELAFPSPLARFARTSGWKKVLFRPAKANVKTFLALSLSIISSIPSSDAMSSPKTDFPTNFVSSTES